MALDVAHLGGVDPGCLPGAFDGLLLAGGVGGGDALTLAIAAGTYAADDGVDLVVIALGIRQALKQKDRSALTHHETVGTGGIGPAAIGAEGADLGEFDVAFGAVAAVYAASESQVAAPRAQGIHGRAEGCQGGGTGRVSGEVGSGEVEEIGHAASDDVGEFAGHGIFGDETEVLPDIVLDAGQEFAAQIRGQGLEGRLGLQVGLVLGQAQAEGGVVVLFAGVGVAQDDRGALTIEGFGRPAVIAEGLVAGSDGPVLDGVQGLQDAGREHEAEAEGIQTVAFHKGADLGVGFIRYGGIRVVKQGGVPAAGGEVADGDFVLIQVFPEGRHVKGIRQDSAQADNCDQIICVHYCAPVMVPAHLSSGRRFGPGRDGICVISSSPEAA